MSRGKAGKRRAVAGEGLTRADNQVTSSDGFNDPNNIRRAQKASVGPSRRAERTGGGPVQSRSKTGVRFAPATHVIAEMTLSTQTQVSPPWNRFLSVAALLSRRVSAPRRRREACSGACARRLGRRVARHALTSGIASLESHMRPELGRGAVT